MNNITTPTKQLCKIFIRKKVILQPSAFSILNSTDLFRQLNRELYDAVNNLSDRFTEISEQNTTLKKRLIKMQKSYDILVEKIDHLETSHHPSEANTNYIENLAENVISQTFSFIYSLTPINPRLGSLDDSTKIIEFTGE